MASHRPHPTPGQPVRVVDACNACGPFPLDPTICRVNIPASTIRWACRCTVWSWTSTREVVVDLAASGAVIDETLPDDGRRECRAFSVALRDSEDVELWAKLA